MEAATSERKATFAAVLAVAEFRALWLAELFSQLGDQAARVALAVLVYQRTDSAALTGLTYALTFLPSMVGGLTLSWIGDRYPRREVIFVVDLLRAALVALMALPGMPLPVLCVLLAVMTALGGPFKAAQLALLADVLKGDQYVLGLSIRQITIQSAQIAGFLGGGLLAQGFSPATGLVIDAVTFVMSALLVRLGLRHRAPTARDSGRRGALGGGLGLLTVWRDPRLRSLAALSWLAGFYIVPEGLAAPYAASLNESSAVAVGVILAADPVGCVIGAFIFGRFVPESVWTRTVATLALLSGVPLMVCALRPDLAMSAILFALAGACAICYQMQVGALFVEILPDHCRAQGMGVMSSGLLTVQGLGILAGGVVATWTGPATAVALAGFAGVVFGAYPAWQWTAARRRTDLTALGSR
ncbi:MFS family permease [Thermocatellispora tengchongensis]|uniref:MFS family permease n=1 Tax=Thermocatellispora tengchongensis TaxID=1073253 RepID=A0A840P8P5_9ACTN|nr:MFS transporter [Thermocatellispora tengchongensis]MBB5135662.1 MFS family permease [Thermocatellispora tengchongensis]